MVNQTPQVPGYSESNIVSHDRLNIIRERPTAAVRDLEIAGQTHIAQEIIDNSFDEGAQCGGAHIVVCLCRDPARNTYQLIIKDRGRGIPIGQNPLTKAYTLVDVTTKPHTSGKFRGAGAYVAAGGLFGQGMKQAAGLSEYFRILSSRPEGTGSLLINRGQHKMEPDLSLVPNDETGVTVVYEPDSTIFHMVDQYPTNGFQGIVNILQRVVFFQPADVKFLILDEPLPPKFWKAGIDQAKKIVDGIFKKASVYWDANAFNPQEWIKENWGVQKNWSWQRHLVMDKFPTYAPNFKALSIYLYFCRGMRGDRMGMVNRISIDGAAQDHMWCLTEALLTALSLHIEDKAIRAWLIASYKLPLFMAVGVNFHGAEPGGTTKDRFKMPEFRAEYQPLLKHWLHKTPEGIDLVTSLYDILKEDIRVRYEESIGTKASTKPMGRVTSRLKRPTMFRDCSTRDNAEVFFVEGESAKNASGHDVERQAIYAMKGKSLNAITNKRGETRNVIIKRLMDNEVYHDIFTILNYNPYKPNLDDLAFKRGLIATDADKIFVQRF